jgi:predicted DNA-binding protein
MELIAVRIAKDMKERLEAIAEQEHRPLSNLVRLVLMQWLEQREKESGKGPDE